MNDSYASHRANVNTSATNEKLDQLLANTLPPRVAIAAQLLAAQVTAGGGIHELADLDRACALDEADRLLAAHEETSGGGR